jgi:hypothetical protein
MKRKKNVPSKWELNQKKAESMTDKFIAVIEKLDCFDSWGSIMIERIITKMVQDSGLSNKPDWSGIADMLEINFGFTILKAESLTEQMKIEEFVNEMKNNPYQLKLTA